MTMRMVWPIAYSLGSSGTLTGTQLRFYDPGTTTPKTVYSDKDLSAAISQPIACDSAGRFPDIYLSGVYKVRWETTAGTEIDTWDYVDPGLSSGSSGILAIANGGTGATSAGAALTALGGAPQTGLDSEISARQALDTRVTVLENAAAFIVPGGRLTLTSATPVLASDVTGAATVYYTPYLHNRVPLWNGTQWILTKVDEVSQALSDNTKSPAAAATSSLYDMFVWNDSGTVRCTRGPAWSSGTARGTGAGTTELERVDGFYLNKVAISNGPAANRGLYVGTIATNASTQLAMMLLPSAAAGGSANRLDVWNMYNRVDVASVCRDSTDTWTYTLATLRAANNNNNNRILFVRGLNEDCADANYRAYFNTSNDGTVAVVGIGLDSTTAIASGSSPGNSLRGASGGGDPISIVANYSGYPGLGQHYVQALEYAEASGTATWYGDNAAPTITQMALSLRMRM